MKYIAFFASILISLSTFSEKKIKGGVDPNVIRQALIKNIPEMRSCYQKQLDISKGSFVFVSMLKFKINAKGKTENVKNIVKNNKKDFRIIAISKCIELAVSEIMFPIPLGGGVVDVSQPINFYPKENE